MTYRNLMDLHTHSDNSHDAHHSVTLLCEKAIEFRLSAIAVTDHCDCLRYKEAKQDIICRQAAFEVRKASKVFEGQINVVCGIELGSPARNTEAVADVMKNNYDFILASVHRIKGKKVSFGHYDFTREDNRPECLIPRYLDELLETAQWNGFDSLAHMTYPLRYYPAKLLENFDIMQYRDRLEAILSTLAKNGKALEINTKGTYVMNGVTYNMHPDLNIVKLFKELGGEYVTVGSDAHSAYDVGSGIADAYELAETAGFKYITLYKNRKPYPVKIERL